MPEDKLDIEDYHQRKSSINPDGHRYKIRIADVAGRFQKRKVAVFLLLLVFYAVVPWLNYKGHPVILIDILHRQFYLFGNSYNAQDFYLVFFLISGVLFTLFYITSVAGRLWCGYACPQTVFLEGVYRKIERLIEGPKANQLLLAKSPWTLIKISKWLLKHSLYLVTSAVVAHIFLSYFVSLESLLGWMLGSPRDHWIAFSWVMAMTLIMYGNFAWFREQLCLIVCPYGRIQSALIDDDTFIIGYDSKRGEPRGKKSDTDRGDCINCRRCVDVCPTGIDIREGLQLECVGCANCVDACDEIMVKVGQKTGLVRYDSYNGFEGKTRRILRPRIYLYTVLFLIGMMVFSFFLYKRSSFEANILRLSDVPYEFVGNKIRNQFKIHLINKGTQNETYRIDFHQFDSMHVTLPINNIVLKSMGGRQVPFFVDMDKEDYKKDTTITVDVHKLGNGEKKQFEVKFLGP